MTAFDLLVEIMKTYLPKDKWCEFFVLLDQFDLEAKRNILEYQRKWDKE